MMQAATLVALSLITQAGAPAHKPGIAVLDIQGTGVEQDLLPTLTEILTVEVDSLGKFSVIAGRDIQAMLGFEQQKDVLGCDDAACIAEIGGALGVDRIISSHIGKVGSTFVVNIKLINIAEANTEGRVYETVRGEVDALIATIQKSVTKLLGESTEAAPEVATAETAPAAEPEPAPEPEVAAAPAPAAPEPVEAPAPNPAPAVTATATPPAGGGIGGTAIALYALGGGLIIGGVVMGLSANTAADNANDPGFVGRQVEAESARSKSMISNILYVAGGAAVVTAFLVSGDDPEAVAWTPWVSPNGSGLAVAGRF